MADTTPPPGSSVRPATLEDAAAIADVQNASNIAEVGFPWTNEEQVRDELTTPGRDPDDDVVVVADDGTTVGYLTVWANGDETTVVHQLAFVHPSRWGTGISAFLLGYGEERARSTGGDAVLRVSRWETNEDAAALFRSLGYRYVRTFRTLRMPLGDAAAPEPPSGIAIRPFDRSADLRAVHATLSEAFADHWGSFAFPGYDAWVHEAIEGEAAGFEPALWFVAVEGHEVVGAVCARRRTARDAETGQIDYLGVRRDRRARGVGRALLLSAFAALARAGASAVELGVDSDSPTGARRLYEAVGMRTAYAYEVWEKQL